MGGVINCCEGYVGVKEKEKKEAVAIEISLLLSQLGACVDVYTPESN